MSVVSGVWQVILLKNLSQEVGLVNGSRGVVVDAVPEGEDPDGELGEMIPIVKFALPGPCALVSQCMRLRRGCGGCGWCG